MKHIILAGDAAERLKELPNYCVNTCVTSPPYFNLRDYGVSGQIGLEKTPQEYIDKLVSVFREVKRVLRDDGTLWVNIGDSYASSGKNRNQDGTANMSSLATKQGTNAGTIIGNIKGGIVPCGCKPKDLIGIPWMLAFALRADGWYLRQDIIWHKPNPMPESVTDRCTKSHEYIFLLSKSKQYYFDSKAIAEPAKYESAARYEYGFGGAKSIEIAETGFGATRPIGDRKLRKNDNTTHGSNGTGFQNHSGYDQLDNPYIRNKRSVWTVTTKPYSGAHFAVFPSELILPCILAGSPTDGTVLDPFTGSGTTAVTALQNGRDFIGVELNPTYVEMAQKRIKCEGHYQERMKVIS